MTPYANVRWHHGSEGHFNSFNLALLGSQQGRGSPGFWFSNSEHAAGYYGPNVAECDLAIKNPLVVSPEMFEETRQGPSHWARQAKETGHDAVVIEDVCDGDVYSTVTCVFDLEKISVRSWKLWDDEQHCRVPAPARRRLSP